LPKKIAKIYTKFRRNVFIIFHFHIELEIGLIKTYRDVSKLNRICINKINKIKYHILKQLMHKHEAFGKVLKKKTNKMFFYFYKNMKH
jgi:ribosomal protein RSM22 (predicted rRNA methylase)